VLIVAWDSFVKPEVVSDMAINQMEMNDEAALALRTTETGLAWQFPLFTIIWFIGTWLIFRMEIKEGISKLKESLK
jgi:hypothetical protein